MLKSCPHSGVPFSAVSATTAATSTSGRVSPPRTSQLHRPVGPSPTIVGLGGCSIPTALLEGARHHGKPKKLNRREPGAREHQHPPTPSHSCGNLWPTSATPDTRHSKAPQRFARHRQKLTGCALFPHFPSLVLAAESGNGTWQQLPALPGILGDFSNKPEH